MRKLIFYGKYEYAENAYLLDKYHVFAFLKRTVSDLLQANVLPGHT